MEDKEARKTMNRSKFANEIAARTNTG